MENWANGFTPSGTYVSPYSYVISQNVVGGVTYYSASNAYQTIYGGSGSIGADGLDLDAVTQAVESAIYTAGGGKVIWGDGIFEYSESLNWRSDNIELAGGPLTVIKLADDYSSGAAPHTGKFLWGFWRNAAVISHIKIHGFTFDPNLANLNDDVVEFHEYYGLMEFWHAKDVEIYGNRIYDDSHTDVIATYYLIGIILSGDNPNESDQINIHDNTFDAPDWFSGNAFVYVYSSKNVNIHHNSVQISDTFALVGGDVTNYNICHNTIVGNASMDIEGGDSGLNLPAINGIVDSNTWKNSGVAQWNGDSGGVYIYAGDGPYNGGADNGRIENLIISNNIIESDSGWTRRFGIAVANASSNTTKNIKILNNIIDATYIIPNTGFTDAFPLIVALPSSPLCDVEIRGNLIFNTQDTYSMDLYGYYTTQETTGNKGDHPLTLSAHVSNLHDNSFPSIATVDANYPKIGSGTVFNNTGDTIGAFGTATTPTANKTYTANVKMHIFYNYGGDAGVTITVDGIALPFSAGMISIILNQGETINFGNLSAFNASNLAVYYCN
jgi:hypothetical protein